MSQREEFSLRRPISCTTLWSDHLLVHLPTFFYFLPKHLMFPQILHSTKLDTPCLQQSRKKKMHYNCLFLKNITRYVHRRLHETNIVGVPCKRVKLCCATLHQSQNNRNVGTCCAKRLIGFKL